MFTTAGLSLLDERCERASARARRGLRLLLRCACAARPRGTAARRQGPAGAAAGRCGSVAARPSCEHATRAAMNVMPMARRMMTAHSLSSRKVIRHERRVAGESIPARAGGRLRAPRCYACARRPTRTRAGRRIRSPMRYPARTSCTHHPVLRRVRHRDRCRSPRRGADRTRCPCTVNPLRAELARCACAATRARAARRPPGSGAPRPAVARAAHRGERALEVVRGLEQRLRHVDALRLHDTRPLALEPLPERLVVLERARRTRA